MNYSELMAKISAHELQKEIKKHKHEVEKKPVHLVEETTHELEIEQEEKEEEKITEHEEAPAEEPKPKKSSGKKPANRAYMVVENIEEQN